MQSFKEFLNEKSKSTFVYSDAEEKLKKSEDLMDDFSVLKSKMKPGYVIVAELDRDGSFTNVSLMKLSYYKELARSIPNYEDYIVIIYK
jgi:hypothetical protein